MKVILYIDTSKIDEATVGVSIDGVKKELKEASKKRKSQAVLLLVDKLLTQNRLTLKDLNAIEVNPGPGSFTGIRVGVSIANTLAQTLGIPVNGKPNSLVEPIYA